MNTVKELNELAEKMVGKNPGSRLDAEAIRFIKNNYEGGGGSTSSYDYIIPNLRIDFTADETRTIENVDTINVLEEIVSDLRLNLKPLQIGAYIENADNDNEWFLKFQYAKQGSSFVFYNVLATSYYSLFTFTIFKLDNNWKIKGKMVS